jgi:hypothetical protein
VLLDPEYTEPCGDIFVRRCKAASGTSGVCASPSSSSSSSEESDTDVASLCSTVDESESEDDSEAVEGSYSCFNGEEDLRWRFRVTFGLRSGVGAPELGLGLGLRVGLNVR